MEKHTLKQGKQTLTLKNNMGQYIQFRIMVREFAGNGQLDADFRADFCYIMGFTTSITGKGPWKHVTASSTPEEFEESWAHWCEHGDDVLYHEAVTAVGKMRKPLADQLEKPDHTVKQDEIDADPN